LLKQQTKIAGNIQENTVESGESIQEKTARLAQTIFPKNRKKREQLSVQLTEMITRAQGKDILVIHSPGGWGNSHWEGLQEWEKSIVTGVTATLEKLGYNLVMMQYFRSGDRWGSHMRDTYKEAQFFLAGVSHRAEVMAEEVKFILQQLPQLKVVLVGASQGASFNNTVMMKLGEIERVYSIELGTFFPHMPRRQLTERNLAIDGNGLMRDPMCHRDLWSGFKAYLGAFGRWFRHRIIGQKVKFTNCINTPGHEYKWEYPEVHRRITEFLTAKFREKR
jgi:hypothetical protein